PLRHQQSQAPGGGGLLRAPAGHRGDEAHRRAGAGDLRRERFPDQQHASRGDGGNAEVREDLHDGGLPGHGTRLPPSGTGRLRRTAARAGLEAHPRVLSGPPRQVMLYALLLLQVAAAATPPPATHDALSYDITLVPADTGTHILGEVQTTWRLRSAGAVTAMLDSSMRVIRVLVDGKPNTRLSRTMYGRSGADVVVPHEKEAGDTLSTRIRYHGFSRGGVVPGPTRAGERGSAGGGSPATARLWLPVPDDPDDRATVRWNVQAPASDRVLASGELVSIDTLPYGHVTWHYQLARPVPVTRLAVATGSYVTVLRATEGCAGCAPVEVWSYPPDSAVAARALGRADDIAAWFTKLLGPFPYARLVHAEAAIPDDAVSSAEMALYAQDAFAAAGPAEPLIARETARQWLGIAVSPDSAAARQLFEGLPRYLAAMWHASAGGPTLAAAMHAVVDSAR